MNIPTACARLRKQLTIKLTKQKTDIRKNNVTLDSYILASSWQYCFGFRKMVFD